MVIITYIALVFSDSLLALGELLVKWFNHVQALGDAPLEPFTLFGRLRLSSLKKWQVGPKRVTRTLSNQNV